MTENTTEWCAGLPLVERRPLEEEERHALLQGTQRYQWRGWGVILLFPVLLVLLGIADDTIDPHSSIGQGFLTVCVIALVFVYLPLGYLIVRDSFRRRKGLRRDVKAGRVKRYAGAITHPPLGDETFLRLLKARLLPDTLDEPWQIEVFPASHRVWKVNGQPVHRWLEAEWTETADPPEFATLAAKWLEPIQRTDEGTLLAGGREMSLDEREELRRYARSLWRRRLPVAVALTLWWSIPLAFLLTGSSPESQSAHDRIFFVFLTFLVFVANLQVAQAIGLARKFNQDVRANRVVILRVEKTVNEPQGQEDTSNPEPAVTVSMEQLPMSGWDWTLEGHPAPWRMTR